MHQIPRAYRAAVCTAVGLFLAWATTGAVAGPTADYGDAPDPTYPSLFGSGGPYHLDVTQEWIGLPGFAGATTTTMEADSLQVDADLDDGYGWWFRQTDAGGVTKSWFVTNLSRSLNRLATDTTYLNVAVDVNHNGTWDGGTEWAVQNFRVPFELLPAGAQTVTVVHRVSDVLDPANLVDSWTRETIGEKIVGDGSGAWGEFQRGETEDWRVDANGNPPSGALGPVFFQKAQNTMSLGLLKAVPKQRIVPCPHGDTHGPETNVGPPAATNSYDWELNVPAGVLALWVSHSLGVGCNGVSATMDSTIFTPGGPVAVTGIGISPELIAMPGAGIVPGARNTFPGLYGITAANGHGICAADYLMFYDDQGGPDRRGRRRHAVFLRFFRLLAAAARVSPRWVDRGHPR